ncbi:hypothetical protein, partial [Pseudomonas lundensis]|uniref:hypothetical protein n=1 Tax=Pseudomonas lundensis TaxID=86185 RepID=UPI001C2F9332
PSIRSQKFSVGAYVTFFGNKGAMETRSFRQIEPGAWPGLWFRVRFALLVHYGESTSKTPTSQHFYAATSSFS